MAIGVVLLFIAIALAILAIRGGYSQLKPWSNNSNTAADTLTSAGSSLNRITKF